MKNLRMIALVTSFAAGSGASALDGGSSSGGGNSREIEFHTRIDKVISILETEAASRALAGVVEPTALRGLAESVQINFTSETLFKDGVSKDALNFPSESRILVSIESWDALIGRPTHKDLLVFHELLGLLLVNDSAYRNSRKLQPFLAEYDQATCATSVDYQSANIEGMWVFNSIAPLIMKISLVRDSTDAETRVKIQSCDRATYLHSQTCAPAVTPQGVPYPDFYARFSHEEGAFFAPDYYKLRVDCKDPKRLIYEKDEPSGMGLSYLLRKRN